MRALVLAGGGSKGAYELGGLQKWMTEDGVDYDLVAGTSVGAINAAHICQTPKGTPKETWEELRGVWERVTTSKVRKSWWLFGVVAALWKPSVYNSEPLQEWIRSELDEEAIRNSGRKLRMVAVSWDSGESFVADETASNVAAWVIASSSYPGMLTPIEIENQLWTDGGLRSVTPLGEAIRAGATDIDVIMTSDPSKPEPFRSKHRAVPDLALRALDILTNQVMRADLKICGLKNDLAGPYRQVNLRVLKPSRSLDAIQDSLDFSQKGIQEMAALGYADAKALS